MDLIKEIDKVLSFLPSQVMKDENLKVSLLEIMSILGQPINRGCPDCYNKAYYRLHRMKQNNYIVDNQRTYLFRKNLHGYRSKKTGKVLNNTNSTVEERLEVFTTSKSHQSLFDTASIPVKQAPVKKAFKPAPVAEVAPEPVVKTTTRKRRTSKKKIQTA